MKKSVLSALFALVSFIGLFGQSQPYDFVVTHETYVSLNNATALDPVAVWDDEYASVPLGFDFNFDDETLDQFYVLGYLGALVSNAEFNSGMDAIFGYGAYSLANINGTEVRYKTEGTAPNRICKIEWYKAGFTDSDGTVSFQIWLYETSNRIDIRMGSSDVVEPELAFFNGSSPLIGLMVDYDEDVNYTIGYSHWVVGDASAPADTILYDYEDEDQPPFGCSGPPSVNLVLSFYPGGTIGTHTSLLPVEKLGIYPNPAHDIVFFSRPLEEERLAQVYDQQGRLLWSAQLPAGATYLPLADEWPAGRYVIRIAGKDKIAVSAIAKQ
ncbi:MAG TPA: T9SS type A sorting domain-containing protein [Saprospiraceae bacterium]|nr:T9SS type A sorting domain-containing protein [Saprospiraceae bacterium]HNM25191.1 T9SS type A sorting domain-containing protein [Saprospiraceae bacterium]